MKRPDKVAAAAIEYVAANSGRVSQSATLSALVDVLDEKYPGAIERARARRKVKVFESKFSGPVPPWCKRLVAKHWPDLGRLQWRRSRTTLRGTCDGWSTITVTERIGTTEERMRILVLHEIAHRRGTGHDERFAAEFRRLLVAEGLYRAALKSGLSGQSKLRRVKAATQPR